MKQNSHPLYGFKWDTSYLTLPSSLYHCLPPERVSQPTLVCLNLSLAQALGLNLDSGCDSEKAAFFSGQIIPENTTPLAQAYAGHQFGYFNMLGDGRAILLGEHLTPSGSRVDIQFKGSGRTPFSRNGDGKATLGSMLREYLMSEALHALGIKTTRSLAVTTTGETVYRDSSKKGAILTRVSESHIRIGTFQYVASRRNLSELQALADYSIHRHYPDLVSLSNPYELFLDRVIQAQATLVAKWLSVGFIHGVMNTDNISICGETLDYGPCAFMNTYHPSTVFSSIDTQGRYAYSNQAPMMKWNLARFAETLLPLLSSTSEEALTLANLALGQFDTYFETAWLNEMRKKLNLNGDSQEDLKIIHGFLDDLEKNKKDFTASFALISDSNPKLIARNEFVEAAIYDAEEKEDFSTFYQLLEALQSPFSSYETYEIIPDSNPYYKTFCGT